MKRVPWWVLVVLLVLGAILALGFSSLSNSGASVAVLPPVRVEPEPTPPAALPETPPPVADTSPLPSLPMAEPLLPPPLKMEKPPPRAPMVEISIDGAEDAEFAALAPRMATCLSDGANVSPGPRKMTITFMRRGNLFEEGQVREHSNPDPFVETCVMDVLRETDTPVAGGVGPAETQNATLSFDPEKHTLEIHRF